MTSPEKRKPILVFDFDGTIADTHTYIVNISNQLSKEFNYDIIKFEELEELKDKSVEEIIQYLKIPVLKIPSILSRARKEYFKNVSSLEPIQGVKEILHQIKELGFKMGILSTNSSENIDKFLDNHNINVFDFIAVTSRIWGKSFSLNKIIRKNGFAKEDLLYIGDEIRDIAAARKMGVQVAAVAWGYNSAKSLEKRAPDFLFHSPADLFKFCE